MSGSGQLTGANSSTHNSPTDSFYRSLVELRFLSTYHPFYRYKFRYPTFRSPIFHIIHFLSISPCSRNFNYQLQFLKVFRSLQSSAPLSFAPQSSAPQSSKNQYQDIFQWLNFNPRIPAFEAFNFTYRHPSANMKNIASASCLYRAIGVGELSVDESASASCQVTTLEQRLLSIISLNRQEISHSDISCNFYSHNNKSTF